MSLIVTRRGIFSRDGFTCQYCGRALPPADLTLDYVLPRCRDGRTTWENIVAACKPCNHRKNDRTPSEAHMRLLRLSFRPRYPAVMLYDMPAAWNKYLGQRA